MTERLSDEDVADIILDGSTMAFQEEIHLLAREVQEWRAKAAADTVRDNPHFFVVSVEQWVTGSAYWYVLLRNRNVHDQYTSNAAWQFDSEAEAREHARLIVAALRNVEVDQ